MLASHQRYGVLGVINFRGSIGGLAQAREEQGGGSIYLEFFGLYCGVNRVPGIRSKLANWKHLGVGRWKIS